MIDPDYDGNIHLGNIQVGSWWWDGRPHHYQVTRVENGEIYYKLYDTNTELHCKEYAFVHRLRPNPNFTKILDQ